MENQKDSLSITEQPYGSFQMNWDKEDPNWKWLNSLTSAEIQVIMKQAINEELQNRD